MDASAWSFFILAALISCHCSLLCHPTIIDPVQLLPVRAGPLAAMRHGYWGTNQLPVPLMMSQVRGPAIKTQQNHRGNVECAAMVVMVAVGEGLREVCMCTCVCVCYSMVSGTSS